MPFKIIQDTILSLYYSSNLHTIVKDYEISKKVLVISSPKIRGWVWALEYSHHMASKGWQVDYLDTTPKARNKKIMNKSLVEKKIFSQFKSRSEKITNRSKKVSQLLVSIYSLIIVLKFFYSKSSSEYFLNSNIPLKRLLFSNMSRWYGTFYLDISEISKYNSFSIIKDLVNTLYCVRRYLNEHGKPDLICTPNGRDATGSAAYSLAKLNGIAFTTLELGFQEFTWEEYKVSPHYPKTWWTKLLKCKEGLATKNEIARFWESRLEGNDYFVERNWRSYYKNGYLPIHNKSNHRLVSFFTSSTHEVPAWKDFLVDSILFKDQFRAAEEILKVCKEQKFTMVIRRHPNSISTAGEDTEANLWEKFAKNPGIVYFGPNSKIDSHALIKQSSVVLCHDSSIGVEALRMKVPAYATGSPFWAIDPKNRIRTIKDLESAIKKPILLDDGVTDSWASLHLTKSNKIKLFKFTEAALAVFEDVPIFYSSNI